MNFLWRQEHQEDYSTLASVVATTKAKTPLLPRIVVVLALVVAAGPDCCTEMKQRLEKAYATPKRCSPRLYDARCCLKSCSTPAWVEPNDYQTAVETATMRLKAAVVVVTTASPLHCFVVPSASVLWQEEKVPLAAALRASRDRARQPVKPVAVTACWGRRSSAAVPRSHLVLGNGDVGVMEPTICRCYVFQKPMKTQEEEKRRPLALLTNKKRQGET